MSQNSYLREFYAQVSQIVFLGDLTVLRLVSNYERNNYKTLISTSLLHNCHKSCS